MKNKFKFANKKQRRRHEYLIREKKRELEQERITKIYDRMTLRYE